MARDQELHPLAQFGLDCIVAGMLALDYTVAEIHDMLDQAIARYRTKGLPDVPDA